MKNLVKLEELGQFILSIILFSQLHYAWWVFPISILLPDLSAIGYLINPKVGAFCYNFFHHKLIAILVWAAGFFMKAEPMMLAGVILFGHSAMDRLFGYGFKYSDNFKHTHLGWIGNTGKE